MNERVLQAISTYEGLTIKENDINMCLSVLTVITTERLD